MQYNEIFSVAKIGSFIRKRFDIFNIFAQYIDCGYTLEAVLMEAYNIFFFSRYYFCHKKRVKIEV